MPGVLGGPGHALLRKEGPCPAVASVSVLGNRVVAWRALSRPTRSSPWLLNLTVLPVQPGTRKTGAKLGKEACGASRMFSSASSTIASRIAGTSASTIGRWTPPRSRAVSGARLTRAVASFRGQVGAGLFQVRRGLTWKFPSTFQVDSGRRWPRQLGPFLRRTRSDGAGACWMRRQNRSSHSGSSGVRRGADRENS